MYFSFALSQVPAHFTKATIFSVSPASTPMICPICSATAAPPTGQAFTAACPMAMAFARASQPAYPQPPQLLPGRHSLTATSFSSMGTLNFSDAIPRRTEITSPVPPTITAASTIPILLIYLSSCQMIPENPKKAMDISPAVTSTIGIPCQEEGISLNSIFSRSPARMTMAMVKPTAVPKP